jgi:predicted outer membrane protein
MRRWHLLLAVMVVLGLLAAPGLATATGTSGHDDDWMERCDFDHQDCTISAAQFLALAAQSNRFEIASGQLAQQRGESTAVRDLGTMFATEHTPLLQQIEGLAGTLGVTLPEGLGPRYQALLDRLQTLSGAQFDRVWLKLQWQVHKEALALLLQGAICGDVPEIRALAQSALPAITRHLAELRAAIAASPQHGDCGCDRSGGGDQGDDSGKHRGRAQSRGHVSHGNGYGHKRHQHA